MALDINTLTPASLKAKEVATQEYVDQSISSIDLDWQVNVQAALNNNQTTIDGSRVTTGTIDAARLNVNDIFSKDITYTGKIVGGSGGLGGTIESVNGNMIIDLVNGSIYIA